MNRRTLKKRCQRAVAVLIAEHGYRPDQFDLAEGNESIDAPTTMERRFVRHGFIEPGPLRGTPLLWRRTSYEYDEWDAFLPSDELGDIEFYEERHRRSVQRMDGARRVTDMIRRARKAGVEVREIGR